MHNIPTVSLYMAWAAALAPLSVFGFILLWAHHYPRFAAALSITAAGVSFLCAAGLLARHGLMDAPVTQTLQWMVSGDLLVPVGVLLDPLSLLMLLIVTLICLLVQIYSVGYMAEDPGFSRYFAYMSLFTWAMVSLVVSPTLIQLYIFWELVGLSSYLLIGFWYEKFSATHAGKKAFVMTRTGDLFFFLGILLLLVHAGTMSIPDLNAGNMTAVLSGPMLTASVLLIFGGIIGKSAQFPLMTWLPDAMEGPTPVSALLHSATMVAAGVFLFGRLFPLFSQSTAAMTVCLTIATVSMLMSATMAMVTRDIKQVWAFSTISQLGFMIMGLAAGGYDAGIFHLTTHAGFKALLFLCSGLLIHAHHTNDIFALSRQRGRQMKIPVIGMVAGAAALSGIWPMSGFFSKEAIMGQLLGLDNPLWFAAGLIGIFLTAYYTFRVIFILIFPRSSFLKANFHTGPSRWPEVVMNGPVMVLAGITAILGFTGTWLGSFLNQTVSESHAGEHAPIWLAGVSLTLVAIAIGLAWLEFGRKAAAQQGFAERVPAIKRFLDERWYLDRIYAWALRIIVYRGVVQLCDQNEARVIDGLVHGISDRVVRWGHAVSGGHAVLIQTKLMVIFGVVFGLTLILLVTG